MTAHNKRQVVVTGIGLITPLGITVNETWSRLINGERAIKRLPKEIIGSGEKELPCKVAAMVNMKEIREKENEWLTNRSAQSVNFISFALAAAKEALEDAEWPPKGNKPYDPTRSGVVISSGIGGAVEEVVSAQKAFDGGKGLRRISPFFVPRLLINLAAGHVSINHNLQGPNHSSVTACASGAHAIGDASRLIEYGDADVMVAGGTESTINALSLAGFTRIKALSTGFNDNPEEASRPFDKDRDGFVMGEGAGIVVLEEATHALNRGAKIYAQVSGYGLSGDAFHLTAPADDGRGAVSCMKAAMRHANLSPEDISYVNAHATSTPKGDLIESSAISKVLNRVVNPKSIAVSSTKGAIGHLLGAAGSVEAIFAILSVWNNILPPTVNLHSLDPGCEFNYVPMYAQERFITAALSNSFGFGGTNTCLAFTKWKDC